MKKGLVVHVRAFASPGLSDLHFAIYQVTNKYISFNFIVGFGYVPHFHSFKALLWPLTSKFRKIIFKGDYSLEWGSFPD